MPTETTNASNREVGITGEIRSGIIVLVGKKILK
jgi:hypothetical protein